MKIYILEGKNTGCVTFDKKKFSQMVLIRLRTWIASL